MNQKLNQPMLEIIPATTPDKIKAAQELFREYETFLGRDLKFQDFEAEVANLPGKYSPPSGRLILAIVDKSKVAGCVALKQLEPGVCEMKRLFVRPEFRSFRVGLHLCETLIQEAKAAGYRTMKLDTFRSLEKAHRLYCQLGFVEISPYYNNPIPDAVFMALDLHAVDD